MTYNVFSGTLNPTHVTSRSRRGAYNLKLVNFDSPYTFSELSTTTTYLQPFFWTTRVSQCQKRSSGLYGAREEADTETIRLGATPSALTSAHLHHPPIFYTPDALPAAQPTMSN